MRIPNFWDQAATIYMTIRLASPDSIPTRPTAAASGPRSYPEQVLQLHKVLAVGKAPTMGP